MVLHTCTASTYNIHITAHRWTARVRLHRPPVFTPRNREMQNLSAEQMSNSPPKSISEKLAPLPSQSQRLGAAALPRGNFLPHKLAQPINSRVIIIINLLTRIHGHQPDRWTRRPYGGHASLPSYLGCCSCLSRPKQNNQDCPQPHKLF